MRPSTWSVPPDRRQGPARPPRSGVSLMEVLISIFVLSVGLLGLAALIPVGNYSVQETGKADRAGMCGRAAIRDLKVRRLLEPAFWNDWHSNRNVLATGWAFALDPLGRNAGLQDLGPLPRLTIVWPGLPADTQRAILESIFFWGDDLVFYLPQDPTLRPEGQFYQPNGRMTADPTAYPANNRHYSWFVTLSPDPTELAAPPNQRTTYNASVAVCYRRRLARDAEQTANVVQWYGAGLGGGGALLDGALELKPKDWIVICGQMVQGFGENMGQPRLFCNWYRVQSAEVVESGQNRRTMVALAGPDWPRNNSGQPLQGAVAVVLRTVVGVYSTTVELDRNAAWLR